jgi:hypothetical protein
MHQDQADITIPAHIGEEWEMVVYQNLFKQLAELAVPVGAQFLADGLVNVRPEAVFGHIIVQPLRYQKHDKGARIFLLDMLAYPGQTPTAMVVNKLAQLLAQILRLFSRETDFRPVALLAAPGHRDGLPSLAGY